MTFEQVMEQALCHFDGMAERSMETLIGLLRSRGWTRAEMAGEIAIHAEELASERRRIAAEVAKQTRAADEYFRRGGRELH